MKNSPMHKKLYEYVVEEIGLMIMKGKVEPGDTLPNEDALCRQYGVSRGVLREATKVLTQKGLIRTQPKIGTRIQPREAWNLFDADVLLWKLKVGDKLDFLKNVTEVRRIIESEAAFFAAQRAEPKECKHIRACYERLAKTLVNEADYDYDTYLELIKSFFFITQAVAENMKANDGGSILNIGSMWGKQAIKATPSSAYSMAKAGLHSLTQHLAMELADYKIRVNAVSPAVVVTPIYGAWLRMPGCALRANRWLMNLA